MPKNRVAKLGRQKLKPTSQPKPYIGEGREEGRSWRETVQDDCTQIERQVAFTFLRLINDILERAVEATAGLHQDLLEPGGRPGWSDAFVA